MKILIFSIGSGNTVSLGTNNEYSGVIGVIGEKVKDEFEDKYPDQEKKFDLAFKLKKLKIKEKIKVPTNDFFEVTSRILNKLDEIIKKYPKTQIDIEISGGYKIIGYALTIISYLRYKNMNNLKFFQFDNEPQRLPIIEIKLAKKEKEIFTIYSKTDYSNIKKLSQNEMFNNYFKEKSYIYRVMRKCRKLGLIDNQKKITDLGKIYLRYGK